MNAFQHKVVQHLNEARTSEVALVRPLQAQIAMTPRGPYRCDLETHLSETRKHAARIGDRLEALGQDANPFTVVVGFWQNVIGQGLALSNTPFDLVRGSRGEEQVLENAKDACASKALEIATYMAIERLASTVGDQESATMAASTKDVARKTTAATKRTARQARKLPGVAQAEGQIKGAVASEEDLAIKRYQELTAEEIVGKLAELAQIDLAKIDSYERKNQNRTTILSRVTSLRGREPWAGYDELTAEVQAVLSEGDEQRVEQARSFEHTHKNRAGVLKPPNANTAMPNHNNQTFAQEGPANPLGLPASPNQRCSC
jgi:ferritin-like metal-binding protein YciE